MSAMLTAPQVAARIGCATQAVRRLMSEGRMPGTKLAGQWRVDADRLEAWLADQQRPHATPKVTITPSALPPVPNHFA